MKRNNSIHITPIANGFIVLLPDAPGNGIIEKSLDNMVSMIRKIDSDPMLEPQQKDNPVENDLLDIRALSDGCAYAFKTFPEVLEFLRYKVVEI